MAKPNPEEFTRILLNTDLSQVVQDHIFQGTPYIFHDSPKVLAILKRHLCDAFDLSESNVIVVGSAKMGFSLNPGNFPRQFSEASDIDVLIVDQVLFDKIWMILLDWRYPLRLTTLGKVLGEWDRNRRREIYYGWLVPSDIKYDGLSLPESLKPLRDISTKWFNTFQSLSQYPEFASRNISGRLYRTWEHALRYHLEGLRQIRDTVSKKERT